MVASPVHSVFPRPEPLHNIAAMPEPLHIMEATAESPGIMDNMPESPAITGAMPQFPVVMNVVREVIKMVPIWVSLAPAHESAPEPTLAPELSPVLGPTPWAPWLSCLNLGGCTWVPCLSYHDHRGRQWTLCQSWHNHCIFLSFLFAPMQPLRSLINPLPAQTAVWICFTPLYCLQHQTRPPLHGPTLDYVYGFPFNISVLILISVSRSSFVTI